MLILQYTPTKYLIIKALLLRKYGKEVPGAEKIFRIRGGLQESHNEKTRRNNWFNLAG